MYEYSDESGGQQISLNGIIGILNISGYNFLGVISQKEFMGKLNGKNIYRIKLAELIPFIEDYQILYSLNMYIEGVTRLLSTGFYFAYNEDLTMSRVKVH